MRESRQRGMRTSLHGSAAAATADRPDDPRPSLASLAGEVIDLSTGFGVLTLPLVLTAVPGIFLFLLLPAIALAAVAAIPAMIGGLLLGPPYIVLRLVRRR